MSQTILVTGASGYVAAHVIRQFLEAGYKVRGTVRSESTASKVKKVHEKYCENVSTVIVKDIAVPGAFDEAVKGVDGVIHVASPFVLDAKDYDKDLFDPAVNGTIGVLKAVQQYNPSVKRIVITSSFASVLTPSAGLRPGYTYTEADWNPVTREEARESDGTIAYLVSKTLAEKAAFDFVESEKPNFCVSTLLPPMVYGPLLHGVESISKLNTSSADFYRLFNGSEKTVPDTGFWAYADVRDLAKAHVLAYEKLEAANQRYLIAGGNYSYQKFNDIIRSKFPELRDTTPEGNANQPLPPVYKLDTSKAEKELGITFTPVEQTVVDTVNSLRELEKTEAEAK